MISTNYSNYSQSQQPSSPAFGKLALSPKAEIILRSIPKDEFETKYLPLLKEVNEHTSKKGIDALLITFGDLKDKVFGALVGSHEIIPESRKSKNAFEQFGTRTIYNDDIEPLNLQEISEKIKSASSEISDKHNLKPHKFADITSLNDIPVNKKYEDWNDVRTRKNNK